MYAHCAMRNQRAVAVYWFVVVVVLEVMMVMTTEGKAPELHRVGGTKGWIPNVNYTNWALHETFYVGDWLYFGFDKRVYNVLEVNKTSYEQCNDKGFIKNITRGGRDVYNLTVAKHFYFLSGGGFCFQGMKLEVNAVDFVPAPEPAPIDKFQTKNGCTPAHSCSCIMIALMFAFAVLSVVLVNF